MDLEWFVNSFRPIECTICDKTVGYKGTGSPREPYYCSFSCLVQAANKTNVGQTPTVLGGQLNLDVQKSNLEKESVPVPCTQASSLALGRLDASTQASAFGRLECQASGLGRLECEDATQKLNAKQEEHHFLNFIEAQAKLDTMGQVEDSFSSASYESDFASVVITEAGSIGETEPDN